MQSDQYEPLVKHHHDILQEAAERTRSIFLHCSLDVGGSHNKAANGIHDHPLPRTLIQEYQLALPGHHILQMRPKCFGPGYTAMPFKSAEEVVQTVLMMCCTPDCHQ